MIDHPWVECDGALFTLRFPAQPALEDIQSFGAATHRFYAQNHEPFAWVVSGAQVSVYGVRHRKELSRVLEQDRDHLSEYCSGMGIVVPNAMVRGAAQAVLWLAPPGYAHRFFPDEPRARQWAKERLRAATSSVQAS